ncbi:MAG: LuxR C-terminal-related transcriptional regulator [Acidobacteriia bacterium]|nr:LuxR C-terminal-related transcriptional regulator [Terriglobia bacterium]
MQDDPALGERPIRVLVADGSRIHTHLLADALKRDSGLEVTPFDSNSKALTEAVRAQSIDVLVINSTLDEQPGRGFAVLRELRGAFPGIRAVILMDSSTDEAVVSAFRAGARGVFSKEEPAQILGKCVRSVHQGQVWANGRELAVAIEALATAPVVRAVNASGMNLLSKRELQVVRSLAEGLTNREIADRLKLSQHTVKNYLFRVFDKLGVSSRVELLFMTLSDAASPLEQTPGAPPGSVVGGSQDDFTLFQKAAEAGLPAAQLALSQMYWARRRDPQDLIQAYSWYLIATECALQAKDLMTRAMTPSQIDEAQKQASSWLARMHSSAPPTDGMADLKPMPLVKDAGSPSIPKRPTKTKEAYPQ